MCLNVTCQCLVQLGIFGDLCNSLVTSTGIDLFVLEEPTIGWNGKQRKLC